MADSILNITNHILCYSDPAVTDSPYQRDIDNRLRLESILVKNPQGSTKTLAPGESFKLFSSTVTTSLSPASTVSIAIASQTNSIYRLTSAGAGFRTSRSVSGINTCDVTINNSALAVFDFSGATLTSIIVGDLMRIKGPGLNDAGPYAFNPINSGIWKIIGVSGTKISAIRETGVAFEGIQETISTSTASDVQFFADDLVRPGQKMQISGTFSSVSHKTYEIISSTPTTIDFISTEAIPEESNLTYVASSITIYTSVKKMVSIECDQECSVRFNDATDDSNRITPLKSGDRYLKGYLSKMGDSYSCEIVNKSVNNCNIKFFSVE